MLSDDARNLLEHAASEYMKQVDQIGSYLSGRGLSKEIANTFRLGYVKDPVVGHEEFKGRLAIPFDTPSGIVDIRFRAITDDGGPKYLSRAGSGQLIYNVNAFEIDSEMIAVCEGELDTIVAQSMIGIPAVGMPGVNGWKDFYWRAFTDYRKVFVLCDGDSAGKEMGRAIATAVDTAVVINMPDGMDVNDVYLAEGSDGLAGRLGL
jgi:DNA primase